MTLLTGCASMQQGMAQADNALRAHGGALLGAAVGATAGALLCDKKDRLKCALAGGAAGASLGYLWDKRRARLRQIAAQQHIAISTANVQTFNSKKQNGLAMAINDGNMFPVGSAQLTPEGAAKLRALATAYRDKPQQLLIIGHTDSTGDDASNLRLSDARARTVAELFASEGIARSRLFYQGVGESQPIASNDTVAGRAANRRVDVIETDTARDLAAYSLEQESNAQYLTHSNKTREEQQVAEANVRNATSSSRAPAANTRIARGAVRSTATQASSVEQHTASHKALADTNPTSSSAPPSSGLSATRATTGRGAPAIDFGGQPASSSIPGVVAAAGPMDSSGGFLGLGLIGTAEAAEDSTLSPCYMNSPRQVAAIRNLASGQVLDTSNIDEADYWPGLNGNIWLANVNGNLVALKNLRVMAGSGTVVGQPQMLVYRNYQPGQQKPTFRNIADMKSYRGRDGLILRSYFSGNAPMKCMDIVMANRSELRAKAGVLYYDGSHALYQKNIEFHRLGAGN